MKKHPKHKRKLSAIVKAKRKHRDPKVKEARLDKKEQRRIERKEMYVACYDFDTIRAASISSFRELKDRFGS